jgi:chromosome partitioning protein
MRRIAVINQKGGVGKTTTTANLGAALAREGRRVLLIDLDPQAHLSLHFGVELADDEPSIYDVLTASMPVREVARNVCRNVTLVPADIDLAGAEVELVSVTGREVLLREALEPIENDHDCLMIDCPPSLGVLTINALVAADEVMIPLQAHFLALQGLSKLLKTVTLVRQRINPRLRVSGIVLCMHESTTRLAAEVVEDLARFLDGARGTEVAWADAAIYGAYIRRNIKLAESASFGQTVFDYAPRSNGAADYNRLAVEVFGDRCSHAAPEIGKAAPSTATFLIAGQST